jgi:hypothetical protein
LFAAESAGYTAVNADRNTDISTAESQSNALLGISKKKEISGNSGDSVTVAELKNNLGHPITNIEVEVEEGGTIFDGFSIEPQSDNDGSDNDSPISDSKFSVSISSGTPFSLKGTLKCGSTSEKKINLSLTASTESNEVSVALGEFKVDVVCITPCEEPTDGEKITSDKSGGVKNEYNELIIGPDVVISGNINAKIDKLFLRDGTKINGNIKNGVEHVYVCDNVEVTGNIKSETIHGSNFSSYNLKDVEQIYCTPQC